jgi:hypothetical protein
MSENDDLIPSHGGSARLQGSPSSQTPSTNAQLTIVMASAQKRLVSLMEEPRAKQAVVGSRGPQDLEVKKQELASTGIGPGGTSRSLSAFKPSSHRAQNTSSPFRPGKPAITLSAGVLSLSSRRRPKNAYAMTQDARNVPSPPAVGISGDELAELCDLASGSHPGSPATTTTSHGAAATPNQAGAVDTTSSRPATRHVDTIAEISHLTRTPDRLYTECTGECPCPDDMVVPIADNVQAENGTTIARKDGALYPAGYRLDTMYAGRQWRCPIRDCGLLYMQAQGLGRHFHV